MEELKGTLIKMLQKYKGKTLDDQLVEELAERFSDETRAGNGIEAALKLFMQQKDHEREVAVVSVIGRDTVGIVADVTRVLSESNANIEGMNQTVLHGFFALILTIDITSMNMDIDSLQSKMDEVAAKKSLKIYIQHENIFKNMNRI